MGGSFGDLTGGKDEQAYVAEGSYQWIFSCYGAADSSGLEGKSDQDVSAGTDANLAEFLDTQQAVERTSPVYLFELCLWAETWKGSATMTTARRTAQLKNCEKAMAFETSQEAFDNMQRYEPMYYMYQGALEIAGIALYEHATGASSVDPGSTILDSFLAYHWVRLTGQAPERFVID